MSASLDDRFVQFSANFSLNLTAFLSAKVNMYNAIAIKAMLQITKPDEYYIQIDKQKFI